MSAMIQTENGSVYVDVRNGVAIQHMKHGGINIQGCECGHPECTGYANWGMDVPPEVTDNGEYYFFAGELVASRKEWENLMFPQK